jgi:N-acyl amino acid synthase of PEP-CTERM/exosortase system
MRATTRGKYSATNNSDPVSHFDTYFELVPADTATLKRSAFQLRFQVYSEELGYEDPRQFPNGLEQDLYDDRASQCLLRHRPTGEWAGVVRLILADATEPTRPFPTEVLAGPRLDGTYLTDIDRRKIGEISRLIVSKRFRRRRGEAGTAYGGTDLTLPLLLIGLLAGVMRMAAQNDVQYLLAILDPTLNRLLRRLGVDLTCIGPAVFLSGERVPCFGSIPDVLTNAKRVNPDAWSIIVSCGTR